MTNLSQIPHTRIISWVQFSKNQKTSIKEYILYLLSNEGALSCRDISTKSGIEIQSLTRPLLELVMENKLHTRSKVKSKTNRLVIAYTLVNGVKTVVND